MKSWFWIIIIVVVSAGCNERFEWDYSAEASKEAAMYVVMNQSDFSKIVNYYGVTYNVWLRTDHAQPNLKVNIPVFTAEHEPKVITAPHLVLYETKENAVCVVFLSDTNPPRIVVKECAHLPPESTLNPDRTAPKALDNASYYPPCGSTPCPEVPFFNPYNH
jgi:hypothetical protein